MSNLKIAMLFCAFTGVFVSADTLNVPDEYSTIQSALDSSGVNDTIVVEPGNYIENIVFPPHPVILTSTDPDDPNTVAATVIDGSAPTDIHNASVITFNAGQGNDTVLEGFTITGGTGTWLAIAWRFQEIYWNRCGGGIVCYNLSQPTIRKNRIINNLAGEAGGIYVYGDPVNPNNPANPPVHIQPVIDNNLFENNSAIVNHGYTPPDATYTFQNHGDGGAIVCFQGVDAQITNNTIQNNHADYYGGGMHFRQWANGRIENNLIQTNNSALGAGVHITYNSSPTVKKNEIIGNVAGSLGGGGIYIYYYSNPIIENNLISENSSTNGAGIACYYNSTAIIENNLIINNNAGTGIRSVGASLPTIRNNTIAGNAGGGIECSYESNAFIENNIIVDNGEGYGIAAYQESYPVIRYNTVWAHATGNYNSEIGDQTGSNGNLSVSPEFIDSTNDFHLKYNSLCINAGDPDFLPENQEDFYGNPRLSGQYVDMGANEAFPIWNANTLNSYQTIQQAIDNANNLEIIVVTRGVHTGEGNRDIDFAGKAITIQSNNPNDPDVAAATIIDSQGSATQPHRGFHFHTNETTNSVVRGLTITGGSSVYEGGAIRCLSSSPTIENCIIIDNLSEGRGGGIYCGTNSHAVIKNCYFSNNAATRGYGGAIACFYDSSPTISNCIMINNKAIGNGHHGGGVCCFTNSNATVENCLVAANSADHRGGGLYAYWSNPIFTNCTVIGNIAKEGGGVGSFRESNPILDNCIVRGNIAEIGNQIALISTIRVWQWEEITEMTVSYSNIEGWLSDEDVWVDTNMILHVGQGNIDVNPNFVDAGYWDNSGTPGDIGDDFFVLGNYHILPDSPCIDAGDPNTVSPPEAVDSDGEARIVNGRIDMGADEVYYSPADFNTDGWVDVVDLSVFAENWLAETPDNVELDDFAEFAAEWLWIGKWLE